MMATEKRLIDANALKKAMRMWPRTKQPVLIYTGTILRGIEDAPTVDAVEVVRCKDCKRCTVTSDGMICEYALPTKRMMDYYIHGSTILARVVADDFCSHGERRNDEDT